MTKHPYRALLIWLMIILALVSIYPTVGWMTLAPEEREARVEKWRLEDNERARERPGFFRDLTYAVKRWTEFDRDRVINLGLDLQGGVHMIIGFNYQDLPPERIQAFIDTGHSHAQIEETVQQTVLNQIMRRVNEFEAREPIIQALGRNQVQVQLPGERDIERATNLITRTAQLNFHTVAGQDETVPIFQRIRREFPDDFIALLEQPLPGEPFTLLAENYERVRDVLDRAQAQGLIPPEKMVAFSQPPRPWQPQRYELYVLDRQPIATGEGLTSAVAVPDSQNPPYWAIHFTNSPEAGTHFGEVTRRNLGRAMAIVIDNQVISAPTIQGEIRTQGQITGRFDGQEAGDLSIALNSGSMMVPVYEELSMVVGASLGADAVRSGVSSALGGLAIVGLFIMFYYLKAGIVALICLLINALFIMALLAYFNMTLTLPGIAGLILTIGMAVDANVLIFERIREELKLGHTLMSSLENTFNRVTVTILDANITTLIAAAILFQFGTGPIEGFAITLTVGVLSTVFTALVVSRAILDFLAGRKLVTEFKMFSLLPRTPHVQWLKYAMPAASASVLLILIGMIVFAMRGREMFGVDFNEGTTMRLIVHADDRIHVEDVRIALAQGGFSAPIVQEIGDGIGTDHNEFLIRVAEIDEARQLGGAELVETPLETLEPEPEAVPADTPAASSEAERAYLAQVDLDAPAEAAPAEAAPVEAAPVEAAPVEAPPLTALAGGQTVGERIRLALAPLATAGSAAQVEIVQEQTIGPAVGAQLRKDAFWAVLASMFFIIIYLSIRFELKFAAGAIVAVAHDVLITLGIFAIIGLQIDMNVVAAILTLVGYSLNDTIVIFDRVREDLRVYRGKGYKFSEILNMAVNNTMARTILTSMTTLFVVVVLAVFGGDALRGFSIALAIGIVAGTYSTIFIASPVVFVWQQYQIKKAQAADAARGAEAGSRRRSGGGKGGPKSQRTRPAE